jgi:hypothetical protein
MLRQVGIVGILDMAPDTHRGARLTFAGRGLGHDQLVEQPSRDNRRNALRAEVAAVKADTSEMRSRMGQVETGIAGLRRDFAHADENTAILSVRIDRLIDRMDRLEKRLELA